MLETERSSSSNESSQQQQTAFMADPFLVLDNDLDDVSEVIKHNMSVHSSSSSSSSNQSTPSPQQSALAKSEVVLEGSGAAEAAVAVHQGQQQSPPTQNDKSANDVVAFDFDPSREHQIGQIVSLLQQPESAQLLVGQSPPARFGEQQSPLDYSTLVRHPHPMYGAQDPMLGAGMSPLEAQQQHNLAFMQGAEFPIEQQEYAGMCEVVATEFIGGEQYHQPRAQADFVFPPLMEDAAQQLSAQYMSASGQYLLDNGLQLESPPPMEPRSGQRGVKQEAMFCHQLQQQSPTAATTLPLGSTEEAMAAKNELIRLLLEMSPQELEQLRASRRQNSSSISSVVYASATSAPTMVPQMQQQPLFSGQLQQNSPPLDPSAPIATGAFFDIATTQIQQSGVVQQQPHQQQFVALDYNNPQVTALNFMPSSAESSALTSPNAFPSLTASDYYGEEDSAMEESVWTEGELTQREMEQLGLELSADGTAGGGTERGGGGGRKRAHKTERRTAHNLIEKKYRCSINDRINQLKEMLATEETTKLSKSATLRRAVDHIFALRNKNAELVGENTRLRQLVEMAGLRVPERVQRGGPAVKQETQQQVRERSGTVRVENGGTGQQQKQQNCRSLVRKCTAPNGGAVVQQRDQSRVTLCVFMFLLLAFNPLSSLFMGDGGLEGEDAELGADKVFAHHRTLAGDERFADAFSGGALPTPSSPPSAGWPFSPFVRHSLIWLLNSLFVFVVLTRLLVYGEPVADRRSPRWSAFLASRRKAATAVAAGNYKEAQRELDESLQLLDRPLPSSGGLDEWMSLTWQIIRHLLNVLWIGRWFARRRRPTVQSQKSVCRSHAATALVYHQLHQLHLLDVDGIGLTPRGAFNLALLAANLAESAGSSAVSHSLRAEIYVCAALRSRLCLPKCIRRIVGAYFFRRAKRHVRKSAHLEGTEMHSLHWIFHPLARQFLAPPEHLAQILSASGAQHTPNWPFSAAAQSPKPVEVLRDAFKVHLMGELLRQLESPDGNLRVADFVEQSHLLLNVCTPDREGERPKAEEGNEEQRVPDLLGLAPSEGDAVCAWWTHLVSGGLHWRHGDSARAQQHYAWVRRCPQGLAQNDLGLAVGLAFCTRKMCFEDRQKAQFAEMVVWHVRKANAHLKRAAWPGSQGMVAGQKGHTSDQSARLQRQFRLLCAHWLLSSLLDVWSFSFADKGLGAPQQMRKLYAEVMGRMERELGAEGHTDAKLTMFRQLEKALLGGENCVVATIEIAKETTAD